MFSLNRLSVIGLGAGLVLVGCASPTDDDADPTDEASAAITSDGEQAQAVNEETAKAMQVDEVMQPATASEEQSPNEATDEGPTESRSDKIIIGGGWGGLGGFGGLGWGGLGRVGWGGGWGGVPVGGLGWGGGWGGVPVGVGWGGGWGGVPLGVGWGGGWGTNLTCGTFGCFGGRTFW